MINDEDFETLSKFGFRCVERHSDITNPYIVYEKDFAIKGKKHERYKISIKRRNGKGTLPFVYQVGWGDFELATNDVLTTYQQALNRLDELLHETLQTVKKQIEKTRKMYNATLQKDTQK